MPRKEWPSKGSSPQDGRLWDELVRERTQVEARLQTRLGDPTVEGLSYLVGSFFNERAIWVTRCPYSRAAAIGSAVSAFAGTTSMPAHAAAA